MLSTEVNEILGEVFGLVTLFDFDGTVSTFLNKEYHTKTESCLIKISFLGSVQIFGC